MVRYLTLHNIEEAKFIINEHLKKLKNEVEEVDLFNAIGRVLAEDVFSNIDVPPYDRAKMDGYAVKAEDTYEADEDNPIELKIMGSLKAGEIKDLKINNGECIEIATGAIIPKGANAVVMVEYTERDNDKVKIYKAVPPMENIQFTGSDI
ncbi:MAG: molybdopterin biosynthesis protein, partial [Methanocaldococcus sp.]